MRTISIGLVLACVALVRAAQGNIDTALIAGTSLFSGNKADPVPQKGKYLETVHGGVVLMGGNAALYLQVAPRTSWRKLLYIKIEYENPLDSGHPLANDMELPPIKRNRLIPRDPGM